jgi:anti-sigma factor RsiW
MRYNCSSETLSAYLDRELSGEELQQFESHLSSCGLCRKRLDSLSQVKGTLRSFEKKRMPIQLRNLLERKAGEMESPSGWKIWVQWPRVWVPAFGLVLMVLMLSLWMIRNVSRNESIPVAALMAAHHRYMDETEVPPADLGSGSFSAKLASFQGSEE